MLGHPGRRLVAMQKLVAQAIAAGTDAAVDPDALPGQVQLYRSAQIGLTRPRRAAVR